MTLWLHMGLPKTGSSALQTFFARNGKVLKERGIFYPWPGAQRTGRPTAGNAKWLAKYEKGWPEESDRAAQLTKWLRRRRSVLLSSEHFSKADPETLAAIRDRAGDVRVLVYVRDQAEMIISRYHQMKELGELRPYSTIDRYFGDGGTSPHLRFGEFLHGVSSIFGRDRMTVKAYRQNKHRLAQSALETLGLTEEGFDFEIGTVNKSPTVETPNPEIVKATRLRYRPENERTVREWFPGQTVEEVFGG